MKKSRLLGTVCTSLYIFISTPSQAALIDNGGGLIYDTVLDITWSHSNFLRNWDDANTWAAGLTLGGVSGWRLPYISAAAGSDPFYDSPIDCSAASEIACRDNELGYMFYHNLGGTLNNSILASSDPDLALFPEIQSMGYWSGNAYDASSVWVFDFTRGLQGNLWNRPFFYEYSWAVHAGNVSPVPAPAALSLFSSGLLWLIGTLGVVNTRKAVS